MSHFLQAQPVWAEDQQCRMNMTCRFEGQFVLPSDGQAYLHIAAATIYRAWLNGSLIAWGPARCGHGCYRVDEWPLDVSAIAGENHLVIEVAGYNVNCYAYLDQPSFLQAEVTDGCSSLLYTAENGGFTCYWDHTRQQRAQRYSFQRSFTEAYDLCASPALERVQLRTQPKKQLLARNVPLPCFTMVSTERLISTGRVVTAAIPKPPFVDRATTQIGPKIKGFVPQELDAYLTQELGVLDFIPDENEVAPAGQLSLAGGRYALYRFARNTTGFISVDVEVSAPCSLYLIFDERLTEGDINYLRLGCVNAVRWRLDKGAHRLLTIEPYTLQYLKVACPDGDVAVCQVSLIECKANLSVLPNPAVGDVQLETIYDAAVQTMLQNSTDIFMDCPSRERAGWLCDSFFTSRGENRITGNNIIERNFLENFLVTDHYDYLPEGMIPMCYPSDHNDGNFIPNWAMWLVLELQDHFHRTGDRDLVDRFEPRITALLDYFASFENEDGLLEDLQGWIFLDWSRANDNDVVCGVNYPSNMLYARMLNAVAALYEKPALTEKATDLYEKIRLQSFNGRNFSDNAVRVNGKLVRGNTVTEACQSYAFFTGTADPQRYPELWDRFLDSFETDGAQRPCPQNAFIGWYVRLAALAQYEAYARIEQDLRRVFYPQAMATGTLWEQTTDVASLNHGFAAYAAELIAQILEHRKVKEGD